MTKEKRGEPGHKVDGRRLRRGKRGGYSRKPIEETDAMQRHAMLLMAIMENLGVPVYRHPKVCLAWAESWR